MKNNYYKIFQKALAIAFCCLLIGQVSYGQNYSQTLLSNWANSITVSATGLPDPICGNTGGFALPGTTISSGCGSCVQSALSSVQPSEYHLLDIDDDLQNISFDIDIDGDAVLYVNAQYASAIGTTNETWVPFEFDYGTGPISQLFRACSTGNSCSYSADLGLPTSTVPILGSMQDAIVITLTGFGPMGEYIQGSVVLPIVVTGPLTTEEPILYSTRTPIIPQTIIYDPPGDGSSSTFNISTEFCRDYSTAVQTSNGFSNNTDITLGVQGSVGVVATLDFEFGVTFSGGFGVTKDKTSETTFENCITISSTFQTSNLDSNIGAPADLIVGISEYQNYAVGDVVELNACIPVIDKQLYVWSDPTQAQLSVMTEELILQDINTLQGVINAGVGASSPVIVTEAQNQIDVWNQILAQKAANEANATFEGNIPYPMGSTLAEEISFSSTQTNTINYQTVVDANVGLEVFANIGGSGASNTSEMTWQDTYGSGTSTTNGGTKIITYEISDATDNLSIDIFRDNVFGTPILRLNPSSATSCPYEGGIRRDQPNVSFSLPATPSITSKDLMVLEDNLNGTVVLNLNICNDSAEDRDYRLELNNNLISAIVEVGNTPLNNTNNTVDYTNIPSGGCQTAILTIERNNSLPTVGQAGYLPLYDIYENLEFKLYPECAEGEADIAILNVRFGDSDGDGINNTIDLCPNDMDTALDFDGVDDQIEVPHNPLFNVVDGDFAFQAWVYPTADQFNAVISKGVGFGGNTVFIYLVDNSSNQNRQGLYLAPNGAGQWQYSNSTVPQNTWSHIAVSFDWATKTATFYLNGIQDGQVNFPTSGTYYNSDTNPFYIGRQGWQCNCNFFEGKMDDVIVWNKAVSATEVLESMAAPLNGSESGLAGYYDFNDDFACAADGSIDAMDKSPNTLNGTLTNFGLNANLTTLCSSNWTSGRNLDSDGDGIGDTCDTEYTEGCPIDYAGGNALIGIISSNTTYETDGILQSTQTIQAPAQVIYDAGASIELNPGFEVVVGAVFEAFIDGCGDLLQDGGAENE